MNNDDCASSNKTEILGMKKKKNNNHLEIIRHFLDFNFDQNGKGSI